MYFPKLIFLFLNERNVGIQGNAFPSFDALNFSGCPIYCNLASANDFKHRKCMLHIAIVFHVENECTVFSMFFLCSPKYFLYSSMLSAYECNLFSIL